MSSESGNEASGASTSSSNLTDDGEPGTSEKDKIINEISSDIFHDITLELCFEVHRSIKLGYFFLFERDIETNEDVAVKDGCDIFGTSQRDVNKLTCVCQRCQKKVKGCQFTAHLLACRGLLKTSDQSGAKNKNDPSTSNSNQTEDRQPVCTSEADKIIKEISSDIFHDIILELCFEVHRSIKLGFFDLFERNIETIEYVAVEDGCDIFGTSQRDVNKLTCICQRCQKKVKGCRFTAHLLACRKLLKTSDQSGVKNKNDPSTSNSNQTEDRQPVCTPEADKIIKEISSDIFHDIILELCFEVHRSIKLGFFDLFERNIETIEYDAVEDGCDIFGNSQRDVNKLTCICQRCQKKVNGCRFTAHLLACRGLLRRSNLRNTRKSGVKPTFQSSIKRSGKKRGLQ